MNALRSRTVGIDLGTSNSAIAVIDVDGRPRILTTEDGHTTVPSVVWFSDHGIRVGHAALPGFEQHPERTVYGAKRLIGRRFDHPQVRKLARVLPYELVPTANGDIGIVIGRGKIVSPEEVAALVLLDLRRMAERYFGAPAVDVIITVPAWFDAAARQATKDAAAIAGLHVRRLLSEPTAAALGYGAHLQTDRRYAVCDLGGGTYDVALVDVAKGMFEVLATTGDAFLGGDDFDRAIVEHLAKDVRNHKNFDVSANPLAVERLRAAARDAKHALSTHAQTHVQIGHLVDLPSGKPFHFERDIAKNEMDAWCAPLVQRLVQPCRDALLRASRPRDMIDEVLLVGGMTRMPAVQRQMASVFGKQPTIVPNPDEIVAVGAALEAARLDGLIEGVLMVDVCARGIAISHADGRCQPVIAQNAVVPTREYRVLTTATDDQPRIVFELWEGESSDRADNRLLGRYVTPELPRAAAGDVLVVVEITLDTDGTLRLAASEIISGERLVIEQRLAAGLGRVEIQRLSKQYDSPVA